MYGCVYAYGLWSPGRRTGTSSTSSLNTPKVPDLVNAAQNLFDLLRQVKVIFGMGLPQFYKPYSYGCQDLIAGYHGSGTRQTIEIQKSSTQNAEMREILRVLFAPNISCWIGWSHIMDTSLPPEKTEALAINFHHTHPRTSPFYPHWPITDDSSIPSDSSHCSSLARWVVRGKSKVPSFKTKRFRFGFATRICPNLESLLSRKLGMLWNAVEFCEVLGIQDVDMMLILVWRFYSKNGRKMLESPSHPSLKCKDQVLTPLPMGNWRADCPTPSFSKPWVKRTTIQLAQPEQKREILSLETAKIECLGAWKWPPVLKHLSQITTSHIPIPHCLHLLLAKKALAERTSSLLSTKSVGTRSLACNCCCKIKPRPRFLIENSALCSAPLLLTQEIVTKLWLWCHLV